MSRFRPKTQPAPGALPWLCVCEIGANHDLETLKQVLVADITICVDIVHSKGEFQLLDLFAVVRKNCKCLHKFGEIDRLIPVL